LNCLLLVLRLLLLLWLAVLDVHWHGDVHVAGAPGEQAIQLQGRHLVRGCWLLHDCGANACVVLACLHLLGHMVRAAISCTVINCQCNHMNCSPELAWITPSCMLPVQPLQLPANVHIE
jgi:hypothetical protein